MRALNFEKILLVIGLLVAIISMFYKQFFSLFFVIPAIIFLIRSIKSAKNKNKEDVYSNIIIMVIFLIGIFLANT